MNVAIDLPQELGAGFGKKTGVGSHQLEHHPLFTDAALIDLIDRFPRKNLYALHMGTDPLRAEENQLALHHGVNGAELLAAVRQGRLWLNLTRVDLADRRYRELITELYEALRLRVPEFRPDSSRGTLLISSPCALVYYHADGPASVLWHLRGRKRIWVYPALDERYMSHELLEDIFAGVRHEYLPYQADYDLAAETYDLEPGQWIAWPQNAPHRVTNFDSLNVSLSTEHFTRQSRRRFQLQLANRYFRTRLGFRGLSRREHGCAAAAKILVRRIAGRLGLDHVEIHRQVAQLSVVPGAPGGVVALDAMRSSIGARA